MEKKKHLIIATILVLMIFLAGTVNVLAECVAGKQVSDEICIFGKFKESGTEQNAYFKKFETGGIWCSDDACNTKLPKKTVIKDITAKADTYYYIGSEGKAIKPSTNSPAPTKTDYDGSPAPPVSKPTSPPPKMGGTVPSAASAAESTSTVCSSAKCEVIGGVTIPISEKDKFYDFSGGWLVEEDENGNLATKDVSAVYSKDGTIKIDNVGNQYILDKTTGVYSQQKGTLKPDAIGGAVSSLGGQVVAPLKGGKYAVGGVVIDKKIYETLQSTAGNKQLSIDILSGDHSISWGDTSNGGSIVQKAGITSITLKQDNNKETKWSLPDGTVLKAKDGWKEDTTSGRLNNPKEGKTVAVNVGGDKTTITETADNNYFKTETIIKTNGDKEIKKYEDDKLKSDTGTFTDGKVKGTYEAEINDKGEVEYFEFKDNEGKRTKIVMGINKDKGAIYTFNEKDGNLVVCDSSNNCKTEEEANEAGGDWETVMELKQRESLSGWTKFAGGLLAAAQATKPYTGISLFLNDAFELDWRTGAEQWFASWSGERVFSSAICERWVDKKPQGSAFVEDAFGNKRPVASIQAERSQSAITLVCDEISPCPENSECKKGLCYESNSKTPQVAYVYKISWGVTAPGDVDLTPLKDEQGNRVSFNIKIGDNWLYERDGITAGAIKLKQGASDKDFMARYSLNPNIGKVCVVWEMAPETKTSFGGEESIDDFCNEVETSALKTWDFGGASAGSGASASVSSGEVKPIGGFLK